MYNVTYIWMGVCVFINKIHKDIKLSYPRKHNYLYNILLL